MVWTRVRPSSMWYVSTASSIRARSDSAEQPVRLPHAGVAEIRNLVQAVHWGELYGLLKDVIDRAKTAANSLEGIMMK